MLTAELLLAAYRKGIFPMAEDASAEEVFWLSPDPRAVLPLDDFHAPRRLQRTLQRNLANGWRVTLDQDFETVMRACAGTREDSWINQQILDAYTELFTLGYAHSIEVWDQEQLTGGLYGVAIEGAFFGESMFSVARDASKIALVVLVQALKVAHYQLLDVQFQTDHLKQFGVTEIPRAHYLEQLQNALQTKTLPLTV